MDFACENNYRKKYNWTHNRKKFIVDMSERMSKSVLNLKIKHTTLYSQSVTLERMILFQNTVSNVQGGSNMTGTDCV
jgi:hypothetical protein